MNNSFLQFIIKDKKTCYFISPHFDDAVLSAGALMTYLSQHVPVVVINVFTKADTPPYTISGKMFLKQCGYNDPQKLFVDREKEDAHVLTKLKAKVINLGFVDALWRKKKVTSLLSRIVPNVGELQALYPTYRFHVLSKKVASQDKEMLQQIKQKLSENIDLENSVIFCPLGTGNHIDHVMTRKASEEQFSSVIYWSDFPYNEKKAEGYEDWSSFTFDQELVKKKALVEGYGTQYQAMFKDGMKLRPEMFFIKEDRYAN